MAAALRLQSINPPVRGRRNLDFSRNLIAGRSAGGWLPPRPLKTISAVAVYSSEPSHSQFVSSVGSPPTSPPTSQWTLTQRHIAALNVAACATAISATWLFCSAIPTMLAFKRAAESLEKLLDVTREELPDTMAAIRLSGMEINDLTMELSDLGQEITKGVRNSTKAVRVAEEKLRGLTNMNPTVPMQEVANLRTKSEPALATTARGIREGIVKGRATWQMFFTITQLSKLVFHYFARRARQKASL